MELELAARQLSELGHATRLAIFRRLVRAGRSGTSVGEIQRALEIPASTLSHHLARMVQVGLVHQERDGRTLYCRLDFAAMEALLDYLYSECCAGDRPFAPSSRPAGGSVSQSTE